MKTAIIFNEVPKGISYFILDNNLSQYNKVYINQYYDNQNKNRLSKKLIEIIYNLEGNIKLKPVPMDKFHQALLQGAKLIECGTLL